MSDNGEGAEALLIEAEALIWALLDEQIDEASAARLTKLLMDHPLVRARYLECVELHVDLQQHFASDGPRKQTGGLMPDLFPGASPMPGLPGMTPTVE
jgi:anti-sigma factor RsiW